MGVWMGVWVGDWVGGLVGWIWVDTWVGWLLDNYKISLSCSWSYLSCSKRAVKSA